MLRTRDTGLDSLLDLDGCIFEQENGFWVKIEARLIAVSVRAPHGIAYSLTLHNVFGNRVLGYDNAHAVKWPRKFKYAGRRQVHDHRHRSSADPGVPYEFESPERLLRDFFAEVDRVIKESSR